jgi:nitroreductase
METLKAILTRRCIREYTTQAVPEELVQELLAAAMQAPSAGNQKPWHFILVTEREQLIALAGVLPFGQSLKTAPIGIVVCADLEHEKHRGYWVQDCSAATQNLLLAAHARGLGAVWLGVYPREERVASLKKVLGLPEQVVPLSVVSLGYPATKPEKPEGRYDESRLHYDRW